MIFSSEAHLDCLRTTILLLAKLNPQEPYPTEGPLEFSLELFWGRLVQHIELQKNLAIVQVTLPLLGSLLSQVAIFAQKPLSFLSLILPILF